MKEKVHSRLWIFFVALWSVMFLVLGCKFVFFIKDTTDITVTPEKIYAGVESTISEETTEIVHPTEIAEEPATVFVTETVEEETAEVIRVTLSTVQSATEVSASQKETTTMATTESVAEQTNRLSETTVVVITTEPTTIVPETTTEETTTRPPATTEPSTAPPETKTVVPTADGRYGTYGRLMIPDVGYSAALFDCNDYDGDYRQQVVDNYDSACFFYLNNSNVMYVGDHGNQGFLCIKNCIAGKTKLYIVFSDGSYLSYICKHIDTRCVYYGEYILDSSERNIKYAGYDLCTVTCNGYTDSMTVVFWDRV